MTQEDHDYQKKIQKENRKRFGEVLKKIRVEKGLSIRKISAQCGLSASYWSYLERGKFGPPSISKTKQIARELGVDSDMLMAEAGHFPPDITKVIRNNPMEMNAAMMNFGKEGIFALLPVIRLGIYDELLENLGIFDLLKMQPEEIFLLLKRILTGFNTSIEEETDLLQKTSKVLELWNIDLESR
ncbi:MAG: helix-turn-helix domain-containing protein [Candidatus Sabulitectum sp.]|nr:helix-turn-helix domain-containing protein [Candidatus Sabulitectum sp.]